MEFRQSFSDESPAPLPPPPPPPFWLEPPTPPQPQTTRASCRIPPGFGLAYDYIMQGVGSVNGKYEMINTGNETTKTSEFGIGSANENGCIFMTTLDPDILRAIEKQKIREEIIAAEMADRRRELEAEVREELRIERELAFMRMKEGDEASQEMEKLNILAKPIAESSNHSATPREAFIPPKESAKYSVFGVWGVRTIEGRKEWRCFICQVSASSETELKQHFNGSKHRSKRAASKAAEKTAAATVSAKPFAGNSTLPVLPENKNRAKGKEKFAFWCEMCSAGANNKYVMEAHKKGKKHLEKLQKKLPFWCDLCKVGAERGHVMESHLNGKKHLNSLREKDAI